MNPNQQMQRQMPNNMPNNMMGQMRPMMNQMQPMMQREGMLPAIKRRLGQKLRLRKGK